MKKIFKKLLKIGLKRFTKIIESCNIITVEGDTVPVDDNCSSFSPLSYIIQEPLIRV